MWTAFLVGKNESDTQVECRVEFRSSQGSDPIQKTVILDPVKDNIVDAASATLVLRQKVTVVLNQLNKVEQLGDLVEANINSQILPVTLSAALPDMGEQIEPTPSLE